MITRTPYKTYVLYSHAKGVEGLLLDRIFAYSEEEALAKAIDAAALEHKAHAKTYWFVQEEKE